MNMFVIGFILLIIAVVIFIFTSKKITVNKEIQQQNEALK